VRDADVNPERSIGILHAPNRASASRGGVVRVGRIGADYAPRVRTVKERPGCPLALEPRTSELQTLASR
jgi:hypothetical protein